MRFAKILLLLPLCVLFSPHRASAQGCVGIMTSEYSSYISYSTNPDLNNPNTATVYSTVVVDGYAAIHTSEYCQIAPGTTHHGYVSNVLGSTGGGLSGPNVCPGCYISVSNSQQIAADAGVIYIEDSEATILCSAIGDIFSSVGTPKLRLALGSFQLRIVQNGVCYYFPTCTGTCTETGRSDAEDQWPGDLCPLYQFCADLVVNGVCDNGICSGNSIFNPNICT